MGKLLQGYHYARKCGEAEKSLCGGIIMSESMIELKKGKTRHDG